MSKNVHMEHCCNVHGCKYGDDDCPVINNIKKQSSKCESCDNDLEMAKNKIEYYFSLLSNDERLNIVSSCCHGCGTLDTSCQCWNDE